MPRQIVIENPVINSPFQEPQRHFRFDDDGITDQIVETRRTSSYFIPIAQPKKKGKQIQQTFEGWTADKIEENKTVNFIRQRVKLWREGGHPGVTHTTARLLEFWKSPDRPRRLFFCQIEAMETMIYIAEAARKFGDTVIENDLRRFSEQHNPGLLRLACKMATGSGKTVVMAMMIVWHMLNKLANPQDARFTDAFLIVTPGITIRDRLRVLLPFDPGNYYRQMQIVPGDALAEMGKAKIIVTNYHAFLRREKINAGRLTKELLAEGGESAFTESEGEMVRRVCRGLGAKKNIVVINDEAHHCYRRRMDAEAVEEKLSGDERREAEKRDEEARVWISGLEALNRKLGVKAVCDLSATPFFLRGSGFSEGTLFPWVVSDFSLIDAIESGIVKVPRVPVADNAMDGELPTYRNIWHRIREDLPKKGRGTEPVGGEPRLPAVLEGAIQSLYANYAKYYQRWEANAEARAANLTPPVFIVVCNNTNVSKLVFDYIAGWEKQLKDGYTVAVPGELPLFSNVDGGRFLARPNTILVDSEQLESGEAMSFDTVRPTWKTRADKCHISHVVADTESWEQKMAATLEDMDEVFCYAKNHNLGFLIPYTINGQQRNYIPDFLVCLDDGHGRDDPLKLILEVTGERDKEKEAKVSTARSLWVPAVNNAGTWGRWAFIEISDPWDAENTIRGFHDQRKNQ